MFELFTYMKQRAITDGDKALGQGVDKCISLWTSMCIAESNHLKKIEKKVERLQKSCASEIQLLDQLLARLRVEFSVLRGASQPPENEVRRPLMRSPLTSSLAHQIT